MAASGSTPEVASPALPPAVLHGTSRLHPDSLEAIDRERSAIAQELEPIDTSATNVPPIPSLSHEPSVRTSASCGRSIGTATTATDPLGPDSRDMRRYRLRRQVPRWYDPITKFWRSQISIAVDERVGGSHRDHLALERTFLGYLKTSLHFTMIGVIIAQLYRLQHSVAPNPHFGYYVLGTPLSTTFIGLGVVVLLTGAVRFWRHQHALTRGKTIAGGWELLVIMGVSLAICIVAFGLVTAVDIHKKVNP